MVALSVALPIHNPSYAATEGSVAANESWFDFKFQGKKVGFFESFDEPTTYEGHPAIHMKRWSVVQVRRENDSIRIESITNVWTDLKGHPLRFKQVRQEGQDLREIEGLRERNTFVIKKNVGGNREQKRLNLKSDVFAAASLDALFNINLKVGQVIHGRAIVEDEGEVREFEIKVTGTEATPEGQAFVVYQKIGGIEARELILSNGRSQSASIPALGAEFIATTRDKAVVFADSFDIFSSALFRLPTALPASEQIQELSVRLSGKSGHRPTYLTDHRMQAKHIDKGGVDLQLRPEVRPLKVPRLSKAGAHMQSFLKETEYESIHDEKLVQTAREVVRDETDAWKAAQKINTFVHNYIDKKTLSRAFATASEVLATKEGDCTEHAVLFSALAKIAGIPTRLVTGLVYVGGSSNVFGYHEWDEVWMGDHWVAIDPTFGQDVVDATHIKFTEGQSDPDGLLNAGVVAAGLMADLDLKVLGYTTVSGAKVVW